MAVAVEIRQSLTNDDLFDAELGEESDGGQNGDLSEEGNVPKSQEHDWLHEQHENNSGGEATNGGSNEETRNEKKENEAKNKPFSNDDLFDAEFGDDSGSGQNGSLSEEDDAAELPVRDWLDKQNDNNSGGEAANSSSDEETRQRKQNKHKKREENKKSAKPRKAKKAELLNMYSETQRMVRESAVRLPYHQPTVLPISHFLKRVPPSDNKKTERNITKTVEEVVITKITPDDNVTPVNNSQVEAPKVTSPISGDTASPTEAVNGVKRVKAIMPKLSAATDPFFLDMDSTLSSLQPVTSGVQSLRERFLKHTSKPQEKLSVPVKHLNIGESKQDEPTETVLPKPTGGGPSIISDDKLKAATPGARLQLLKEQLQAKMKVKRAEIRKIQESQRKLDNEEISEEEEEEMTEEEDDSDYELDKWNEEDERKQEEGESDLDEKAKDKNAFVDDEADESESDHDNGGYDIDSGSEGDISDGNESDDSADEKSVFSDDGLSKPTAKRKSKKKQKESKQSNFNIEDITMDLYGDSRSRDDSKGESNDSLPTNSNAVKDSGESAASLCLRLDSVEDGDESNFNFPSLPASSKLKTKVGSKVDNSLMNITEVSQESSQSSFGGLLSSELGESTNSLGASSDSSRIPPGQGENNAQGNDELPFSKKTPELFSSFSRLRNLIGMSNDGDAHPAKKPGKLSQLALPIEDSQDLFDDESGRTEENSKQDRNRTDTTSSDFHFSLDEDTQFTQILNTQGFINSSKRSKSKTKKLFEDATMNSSTQPHMKELLGLCSGKFSYSEDSRAFKGTETRGETEKQQKSAMFGTQDKQLNMKELLGLCSGRFTDDENELGDDVSKSRGKDSDLELGHRENRSHVEEEEEEYKKGETSDEEDESDPEEMVLKWKSGKKYKAKKSIFDKRNFYEKEAELSGSDVGSDEDEDIATDEDVLEEDSGAEELPSEEELQKQINKVHMKTIHDQDNAELRAFKERFLADGELYTDGQGRTRHFRWRGIDENSQFGLFGNKDFWGEEDGIAMELSTEEEIQRRKERYEKEAFLREEMDKQNSDVLDIDESSQNILSKIKDTSSQLPEAPNKPQAIINPKSSIVPVLKKKASFKGSFLKHSKTTLSRLSSLTSNTPNSSVTSRGFVFQTVSPSSKNNSNTKKIQRTDSVIEQPASKKPRLDRSLSDSNSVFSML